LVSDEVGSGATVSVAVVSVVGGVSDADVSVLMTVVVGRVVVASGAVEGASSVAPGTVSVRVGSVGRVTLGRVPVGNSVTPDKPVTPPKSPPPQPPRR
jgi:hypothetical protein